MGAELDQQDWLAARAWKAACFHCTAPEGAKPEPYAAITVCFECWRGLFPTKH